MAIEWKEVTELEDELLRKALSLYHDCFPEYVREDECVFYESIRQREKNTPNNFHFLVGIVDDKVICFSTAHYLAKVNSGYIVYIAADPKERGKGLGKQTLLKMEKLLKEDAVHAGYPSLKGIFLETEREIDAQNEEEYKETINRLQFFNHLGFSPIKGYQYVQPPLYTGQTPVPLYLAFKKLTRGEDINYDQVVKAIYHEKYHKMNKISSTVLDECITPQGNISETIQ